VDATHQHPPDSACLPTCPAWAESALELFALKRRYADMLAACETADGIEYVCVSPGDPGVVLPEYLCSAALVRLNLVVGRDTPELSLDEWGIRCTLTFRGRRVECALPWSCVRAGALRPPKRRFQVIAGGQGEVRADERARPPATLRLVHGEEE
jgi:hypothetical protein